MGKVGFHRTLTKVFFLYGKQSAIKGEYDSVKCLPADDFVVFAMIEEYRQREHEIHDVAIYVVLEESSSVGYAIADYPLLSGFIFKTLPKFPAFVEGHIA